MITQTDTRSADLYARALKVLPGGVSRNTVLRDPHPTYASHASGCHIVDIEGMSRIDFANNMASLIHGHAYPPIIEAVTEQLARGTAFTLATEIEIRFAEHLVSRNPSFEKVRFVNSGTEAIMAMLKASRAYTGRAKIAKIEGTYHGGYDYAEVSQAPHPASWGEAHRPHSVPLVHGTPASALDDVVVIPLNDADQAIAILDQHAAELACVLLDLMPHRAGLVPAEQSFVNAIREWTTQHGILLALDEVITFRSEYGGLQSRYGITPDLTAMGKMIGGGFPIGAVAGRAEVMDVMNARSSAVRYPLSGTFSANPISMTAGLIAMEHFDQRATQRLNDLTTRTVKRIEEAIHTTGIAACVTGTGSMFRIHMKAQSPRNYRDAYLDPQETNRLAQMLDHLFDAGFMMINTCSATLSTPMTETDVDALVNAVQVGFERIQCAGT